MPVSYTHLDVYKRQCHDSEWMKSPAHRVLTQYIRIMKLHRSILEQRLNKTGVYRSQHQILTAMAEHPNTSQKELAEYLNVTAATVAVSVKKLEKGGYITRIVDQEDNRYKMCIRDSCMSLHFGSPIRITVSLPGSGTIFFRNTTRELP